MTKTYNAKQFAALLKNLRKERGLGVNQLAGYVGISGAEISRIERGERKKINPNLLKKLAPKLDVTYEYLMWKAGYLPEKVSEEEEIYLTSGNILSDLSPGDKKLVLDLIKRLKQK